jgi:hypothetical protein
MSSPLRFLRYSGQDWIVPLEGIPLAEQTTLQDIIWNYKSYGYQAAPGGVPGKECCEIAWIEDANPVPAKNPPCCETGNLGSMRSSLQNETENLSTL